MRFEHIEIDGSQAFATAAHRALSILRSAPNWRYMAKVTRIRELENQPVSAGGYLFGSEVNVGRGWWQGDAKSYAGMLSHEGAHASRGGAYGAEEETFAFRVQAETLRQVGGSSSEIAECERQARSPTHQDAWASEYHGGSSPSLTPAGPDAGGGSVARWAAAYYSYKK